MKQEYMRRAISLARKGLGYTSPNPVVGAVIVKNGRILGEGYHQQWGGLHAERNALAACTESPRGAEMYVTLEPCCHYGKTPPCTEAILEAGISKVIVGSQDPNPLVSGKGAELLRSKGVLVEMGFMKEECDRLNAVFFHYIWEKTPYVALKYAMTADGKIATKTGASQWITGEAARAHVQKLRHQYTGIMVGIGTVLADDPRLTCRMEGGKNPVRIICDSRLRIPLDTAVCQTAKEIPTIIAACCSEQDESRHKKIQQLKELGIEVLELSAKNGSVDLAALMKSLGEKQIDGILLEGGSRLAAAALEEGIVKKIYAYIAPKIFGSQQAKGPIGGSGAAFPNEAAALELTGVTHFAEDLLLEYEVK